MLSKLDALVYSALHLQYIHFEAHVANFNKCFNVLLEKLKT